MKIEFFQSDHRYLLGGRRVPSVTDVLSRLFDGSKIPEEWREEALNFGSRVHQACELDDLGKLDESGTDEYLMAHVRGWRLFRQQTGFTPDLIEARVASTKYGYAGTLDRYGRMGSRNALVDIKSGAKHPVVEPQTAAYQQALLETAGFKTSVRYAVYLMPDHYQAVRRGPEHNAHDWATFRSCLTIYHWMKNQGV